jgi:hypothetical protein
VDDADALVEVHHRLTGLALHGCRLATDRGMRGYLNRGSRKSVSIIGPQRLRSRTLTADCGSDFVRFFGPTINIDEAAIDREDSSEGR